MAWDSAQVAKHLLRKPKFDPQNLYENLGVVECSCNPELRRGKQEDPRAHWSARPSTSTKDPI